MENILKIKVGYNPYKQVFCENSCTVMVNNYNGEKYVHFITLSEQEIDFDRNNLYLITEVSEVNFVKKLTLVRSSKEGEKYYG